MNHEPTLIYRDLLDRLGRVRRKANIAALIRGLLLTTLIAAGLFLTALLTEEMLYLGIVGRTTIFWLSVTVVAGLFCPMVGLPVLRLLKILPDQSNAAIARTVGRYFPAVGDHLENILQLFDERSDSRFFSAALIDASFEDIAVEIQGLDFSPVVSYGGVRRPGALLGITVTVLLLLFVIFPDPFGSSANRLWNHTQSFGAPVPFRLSIEPGNKEVVKGENVSILVRVDGELHEPVKLASRPTGQTVSEEHLLLKTTGGDYTYEFTRLKATTTYFAESGPVRTEEYTLTVTDRPVIKMLRLRLDFPHYTTLPPKQLDDNVGDVTALKGSKISVAIEASKDLSEAMMVMNDSSTARLEVKGTRALGDAILLNDHTYHVLLKDGDGRSSIDPIEYTMRIIPDAYPTATILLPGSNIDVTDNTSVTMLFKITDDYGFTRLRLAYSLVQSRYEKPANEFTFVNVPLPAGISTGGSVTYTWPLGKLSLVPEDVLAYYIEVFDNDNVSGPKSAVSETYLLRLPSLDEVFADVDRGHQESLEGMKDALQQAQEAKKDLEELRQELKKEQQKLDWQDQKKAEELVKNYEEIQKRMEEVGRKVDQMVGDMQKNRVLSRETLEKYQELQEMMEQLNSPEFAEAMKKLQETMQQLSPDALRQALLQFSFSEETFRKSIERTLNLLKRIQIEQKVDEIVKRAEEMAKKQEEMTEKTERLDTKDQQQTQELAQQQKDLNNLLADLEKKLGQLQEKMEEFPREMPLAEMEKAKDDLKQSGLDDMIDQIAREIQEQQPARAVQDQKAARQKMDAFAQQMKNMKQSLEQNQQRHIVNEMRRVLQDLLELSQRQEALKDEARGMEQNSPRFRENAQQQMEVLRDLGIVTERLSSLAQKTFSVSPEMGKSIGDAMRNMGDAMRSLDQRNGRMAGDQQAAAMGSLNEAAQLVESAVNGMMQAGGQGMGIGSFMQRLQKLTQMQQGINQGTQNLGGLTPEQAASMARLAGEQGMVRKSLEQLAREAASTGELKQMLGDMTKIAQDMRDVQTDLVQGNVNPETLRRQERIVSRLLDSQRSMRERDFENKRRAESGKNLAKRSPGMIDLSTQDARTRLRRDLLRALEEGYTRDYEELIKKYFEVLER